MLNVTNTVLAASLLFLSQSAAGPPAHSGERHVILINNTREPIAEIYVSEDHAGDWQEDLLGSELLLPGKSVSVDIEDRNGNCRVDVKTVFDNGSDLVNRGVNTCRPAGHVVSIQ
jgi:hypothetical protein